MVKGFYIVGFFDKGKKPQVDFVTQREKPFEIDTIYGDVKPRAFHIWNINKNAPHIVFPKEWMFIEGYDIKDVEKNENTSIRKFLNDIWFDWCKKHKRKQNKILKEEL